MPTSRQSPRLLSRRAAALAAVERCTALLTQDFGARRVVLFGSLAGQDFWRAGSDIDLAVEGLNPARFFAAYSACREVLPRGVELDLVPLERAYPELRARILGEVEMPDDPLQALGALVDDEVVALERVSQEMRALLQECAQPPTGIELRAAASILHEFYNGVERILQRIAVGMGEEVPHGAQWHVDLLSQMATPREGQRPAVIDEPLRARLKDYLDFRHFFRRAYGYMLVWSQMQWKAEQLPDTLKMFREQLRGFFENVLD